MGSWSKKPIELLVQENANNQMHRTLSTTNLVLLGVGGIIGAGIFVLTGQAAAQYAGPAIVISFLISGFFCACAALCYAELTAMIPVSGSAYSYAYTIFGQLIAWIVGWDLLLEYLFGAATVSVGWSGYVTSFLAEFGVVIPAHFSQAPFSFSAATGWQATGAWINAPAVALIAGLTTLCAVGIRESSMLNDVVVYIKLMVLLLFIAGGALYVSTDNLVPFIPENTGQYGQFGFSGIIRGAAVIFFAYIGFDCLSTLALESKTPQHSLPRGIIYSLLICTGLYVMVAFVLTGMIHYSMLNVPQPIALALDSIAPALSWLRPLLKIGAIAGLSTATLGLLIAQPRILYSMARDGFLPKLFAELHVRCKTPVWSTIVTGVGAALVAGLLPIGLLGELVSIGTLLAFLLVCVGVLVLRVTRPHVERPFKTPWVWFVGGAGAVGNLWQMASLPFDTWVRLLVWLALGMAIYYGYSVRHVKRY